MGRPRNIDQLAGTGSLNATRIGAALAVIAATYFAITEYRPQGDFFSLFLSRPHLLCAAAFGLVTRRLDPHVAAPLVSGLSFAIIAGFFGWIPLVVSVAQALVLYPAVALTYRRSATAQALATTAALGAGLCACWLLRVQSLGPIGLWVFALLRYISFSVDVRRGARPDFVPFLCYGFYYPALLQTEQYADFTAKNLVSGWQPDYVRAARRLALGWLKITAAIAVPHSFADVLVISSFASGWGTVLVVYVKTVLFIGGAFDCIQGVSSLHGITIRENFPGVLLAHSPSMFWRRWRATMTDFFISYVYIPLGGREHRSRNIVAVFACSVLWHWIGVPFSGGKLFFPHYLPVLMFGIWNASIMVVAGYFQAKPRADDAKHDNPEAAGYREFRILATAVFGSITINILAYRPQTADALVSNMKVLFPVLALLGH